MYLLFFSFLFSVLRLFYVNLLLKWFWVGVVSFVGGFGETGYRRFCIWRLRYDCRMDFESDVCCVLLKMYAVSLRMIYCRINFSLNFGRLCFWILWFHSNHLFHCHFLCVFIFVPLCVMHIVRYLLDTKPMIVFPFGWWSRNFQLGTVSMMRLNYIMHSWYANWEAFSELWCFTYISILH